jgi:hypothetical protein
VRHQVQPGRRVEEDLEAEGLCFLCGRSASCRRGSS